MRVTGSAVLEAPREQVWAVLHDPAVLARTVPGCRRLEQAGTDVYRGSVEAGMASTAGVYDGEITVTDRAEPSSFVLHASGAGSPGTVEADVTVTLTEVDGGSTRLDYDADAVVGGVLGGVGRRMLAGVAERTAGEFFAAVDDVLAEEPEAPPSGAELAGPAIAVPGVTGQPITITGQEDERQAQTAPVRDGLVVPAGGVLGAVVAGVLIFFAGVLIGLLIGS